MPIFERNNQKVHFVHIPKTGGMSIRYALESSGWVNLYETQKGTLKLPSGKTYHGHMPYSQWRGWEEVDACSFEFALVRNPVDRMRSLIEMHLRHFLEIMKNRAWSTGGGNTPEMRDFLIEVGLLPKSGYTEAQIISGIYNIVIPNDPEIVQAVADQNSVTREEYIQQIEKNHNYVSRTIGIREVEKYFGRQFEQVSWVDLMRMYFDQCDIQNHEREGVVPCPSNKYLSPRTHVYKFENISQVFNDLEARGIIDAGLECHDNRSYKFPVTQPFSWDQDWATHDTFFNLFGPDFDLFDYDRSTPFPNMK